LGNLAEIDNEVLVAVELKVENLELTAAGAGIRVGLSDTSELRVMKWQFPMPMNGLWKSRTRRNALTSSKLVNAKL